MPLGRAAVPGQKLLVVPMKQRCHAAALADVGVPVVRGPKDKHLACIDEWLHRGQPVPVH